MTILATAPTIERLQQIVRDFFCNPKITINGDAVFRGNGEKLEAFRIVKQGKRFRFESITKGTGNE